MGNSKARKLLRPAKRKFSGDRFTTGAAVAALDQVPVAAAAEAPLPPKENWMQKSQVGYLETNSRLPPPPLTRPRIQTIPSQTIPRVLTTTATLDLLLAVVLTRLHDQELVCLIWSVCRRYYSQHALVKLVEQGIFTWRRPFVQV